MNLKLNSLAITVIFLSAGVIHAEPGTETDYYKDKTKLYTHTALGESFEAVNHILCMFAQTAYSSPFVLNQGIYGALIDEASCDNGGSPDGAGGANPNTAAQGGSSIEYGKWQITSARKETSDPQTVRAYIETPQKNTYQAQFTITGDVSASNDLGVFKGYYKDASPASTRKGMITSSVSNGLVSLKHAEKGVSIMNFKGKKFSWDIDSNSVIEKNLTEGSGSMSAKDNLPEHMGMTMTANFAYNANNYLVVPTGDAAMMLPQCFDRLKTESSAWRYGLYNTDGSRVELKAGFPINTKADGTGGNGYFGSAGLFTGKGVTFKNGDAVYKERRAGDSDTQAYTLSIKKGVLKKFIRNSEVLGNIDNIPMMGPIGVPTSPDQVVSRIIWNGTALVIDATTVGWGNLDWIPESTPIPINKSFSVAHTTLKLWSEGLGGNVSIELKNCEQVKTIAGGFNCDAPTAETPVIYYTETQLALGDTVPTLTCYNDCPQMNGKELSDETVNVDTLGTSPITPPTYTFKKGLLLDSSGDAIIPSDKYKGAGVHSGALFEANKDNLGKLKCGFDPTKLCPWDAWSELDVVYTWSTSNNDRDKVFTLKDSSGVVVKLDPAIDLSFTYPSTATGYNSRKTDEKFAGSKFRLQYFSFGDLGNIPAMCVNPEKPGVKVDDCSEEGLRMVPEFTIPPGTTVTSKLTDKKGTKSYLLKPLEIEQRFPIVKTELCSALTNSANKDKSKLFLNIKKDWVDPAVVKVTPPPALRVIAGEVQP